MDFPTSEADSPTNFRGIAGPSRARLEARQHRNSALKPYERPTSGSAGLLGATRKRTESALSTSAQTAKSRESVEEVKKGGGSGGLLSGLRQAIFSRPLSWLQGSNGSKSQAGLSSLPSHAQQSAAQRLAGSVNSKYAGREGAEDIESFGTGMAGTPRMVAPPVAKRYQPQSQQDSSLAQVVNSPARSPSPARSTASAAIQSHGRQRLSVGPSSHLGTPGYRRAGSVRLDDVGLVASQSSPSYAFGYGSEKRLAGISSTASAHAMSPLASSSYAPLTSRSPFAMNRHSVAGSSAGGSTLGAERSFNRFGGFNSLATPSRSRPTSVFGGEMSSRSRAGSVADSRMSTSSQTPKRREWSSLKLAPPKRDMSEGEELMQAYMAMRNGAAPRPGMEHPALHNDVESDALMMEFGAGPSAFPRAGVHDDAGSLKRGASMSLDGNEALSESVPRKRQKQMVWDAEMGFVSKEDVRARQPPRPVAKNEAERLLNALEGMRGPIASSSRDGISQASTVSAEGDGGMYGRAELSLPPLAMTQPLRQMMSVSVPLSVPERLAVEEGQRRKKAEGLSKTVSPYSRALKERSKLSESVEPEEGRGLQSRLRKSVRRAEVRGDRRREEEDKEGLDARMSAQSDENDEPGSEEHMEESEEGDEEAVVEPPRRRLGASVRSGKGDEKRTLRSGKVLEPASPAKKTSTATTSASKVANTPLQTSKPMSRARLEIPASGASAANRLRAGVQQPTAEPKAVSSATSHFQVLSEADGKPMERSRSVLRQGAEKTHRSHAKSGRVGLDEDEDEEVEDSPSNDELNKIKLPTNLFPQGFSFSGSSSPSLRSSGQATPSRDEGGAGSSHSALKALPAPASSTDAEKSKEEGKGKGADGAESSLLSRLGGFAAEKTGGPASAPAQPSFSFAAPSKTSEPAPASKPLFSFQPSPAPAPTPTPAPASTGSDFFKAAEKSPASTPPVARNDGPVPNFFASSLAKSSSSPGEPSERVGKEPGVGEPNGRSSAPQAANPSAFVSNAAAKSGAKTGEQHTVQAGGFTGSGGPWTGFTDTGKAEKQSDGGGGSTKFAADGPSKPASFGAFGAPASKPPTSVPASSPSPFSFTPNPGTSTAPFSVPSDDMSKKRGADDEGEAPHKKANGSSPGSFAFGANPGTSTPIFSGPSGETGKKGGADDEGEAANKKANGFTTGSFAFGPPAPAEKNEQGGFSFGGPKPSTSAEAKASFSFGNPSKAEESSEPKTPSAASFNFGNNGSFGSGGKTEMMDTSPSSTSNAAATGGGPASQAPSKPLFSFGGPSISPGPGSQPGFSFGSSTTPAKPETPSTSTASFGFGAATGNSGGAMFGSSSAAANSGTPASNPFGGASSGGFGGTSGGGFGSSSNSAADANKQGSPAPFAFGSGGGNATSQPMTSGFSGGFGSSQPQPSNPSGSSFTFGAPSSGGGSGSGAVTPTHTRSGGGFSFSMPASANSSMAASNTNAFGNAGGAGSPAPASPFVFGSGNSTPPPSQPPPSAGFGGFGMSSPAGGGASAAPQPSPSGGSLFNIGAPPAAGAGNRPVRGMPSRRKR